MFTTQFKVLIVGLALGLLFVVVFANQLLLSKRVELLSQESFKSASVSANSVKLVNEIRLSLTPSPTASPTAVPHFFKKLK